MSRVLSDDAVFLEIETETASGSARWLLPLAIVWGDAATPPLPTQLALARVRRGAKVGLLTDAFALPAFPRGVLAGLVQQDNIAMDHGVIRFSSTSRIADITVPNDVEMHWISAEQSNSSVIVGDIAIIKLFRRVTSGPHPEAEMSRYLTDQGFANTPALLGEIVRIDPDETSHALLIAQAFVRNQGDAWGWTLELLLRGLSDIAGGDEAAAADATTHADYVRFASLLGQRLGEMHLVLARALLRSRLRSRDRNRRDGFGLRRTRPHPTRSRLPRSRRRAAVAQAAAEQDRATLQSAREVLFNKLPALAALIEGATLTRIHGDLHLGQILVVNGDVAIIDFEGEPADPVEQRRSKDHPSRDVAGMIRSFDYAAAVVKRRSQASHAHLAEDQVSAFLDSFVERATDPF